jgi:hypothetical protein
MSIEPVQTNDNVAALLCVGDSAGGDNIALKPVFGRPFIHHLIKRLEALGIQRFFIGIDSVPGSLLTYGDEAKREGLDVQFVRNPGDMAASLPADSRILLQMADIVWDDKLVQSAMAENRPLVAAVEERAENQRFERIDLNHRWGGLAILPRASVEALTSLPDGWDMGSSLLRHALQDGISLWQVRQSEIQSGSVRAVGVETDAKALASIIDLQADNAPNALEKWTISPLIDRLLPSSWTTRWMRTAVEWTFPAASLMSGVLAWLDLSIESTVMALVAIFGASWRERVAHAEYRVGSRDWIGLATWLVLALALGLSLYNGYETPVEAAFLTATLGGLAIISRAAKFWLVSPLALALALLWGQVAGLPGPTVRLLIVAQLALLILSMRKSGQKSDQT